MNNENNNLKEKYEEYHKNSGTQTKIVESRNFTHRVALSFIDRYLRPGMEVLDIGCGVGIISLYIANKGNEVLGIDISEKAINAAKKSAKILGLKNASFKAIDFLDADFQERFDFIICCEVLEHLIDDKLAIRKIHNLLKANGTLFLSTRSEKDLMHKVQIKLFGKDKFDISVGHLRRYSTEKSIQILKLNEFKITETKQAEGFFRTFLFTTKIGKFLLIFANLPIINPLFTLLNNLSLCLFGGAAQIIIVAKAVKTVDE
jgi:ubiquinone biosynthesis O-methyltransferase